MSKGRVLIIAGSDSGGGAGLQADIKAVTALGGYAYTAVTALTAQDTASVAAVHAPPPDFLRLQLEHSWSDLGADAVKLGMLHDAAAIEVVAEFLEARAAGPAPAPVVADPVMVSAGGDRLLAAEAEEALKRRILPLAYLATPNLHEAEALLGGRVSQSGEGLMEAARALLALGPEAVLLKGGHMAEEHSPPGQVMDALAGAAGEEVFVSPRLALRGSPHGTGCTLASAIAAELAFGKGLREAVAAARAYLHGALAAAPGLGRGNTPLHHAWRVKRQP